MRVRNVGFRQGKCVVCVALKRAGAASTFTRRLPATCASPCIMALDFPALLATFPPGAWPSKDDDGHRLSVTTNPLRNIARPRNKSLITRIASPGAPAVVLSGAVSAVVEYVLLGTDGTSLAPDAAFLIALDPVVVKSFLLGYLPYLSPVELLKMANELIDSRLKHERGRMPAAPKRRFVVVHSSVLTDAQAAHVLLRVARHVRI